MTIIKKNIFNIMMLILMHINMFIYIPLYVIKRKSDKLLLITEQILNKRK